MFIAFYYLRVSKKKSAEIFNNTFVTLRYVNSVPHNDLQHTLDYCCTIIMHSLHVYTGYS